VTNLAISCLPAPADTILTLAMLQYTLRQFDRVRKLSQFMEGEKRGQENENWIVDWIGAHRACCCGFAVRCLSLLFFAQQFRFILPHLVTILFFDASKIV
jgi:hypothetical protein